MEATEYSSRWLTYQDRHRAKAKLIIKPTVNLTSVRRMFPRKKAEYEDLCVHTGLQRRKN